MPLQLSHVAEEVVAALINRARPAFLHRIGLTADIDWDWLTDPRIDIAFPHVPLAALDGRRFDGAHTIDVLVFLSPTRAVPLELKLGETGLTSSKFCEWLAPCRTSHNGTAWASTMMSILDRRFPAGTDGEALMARLGSIDVSLCRTWVLLTRRAIAFDEDLLGSHACRVAIEDLVENAGGPRRFNHLVREILVGNYHQLWLGEAAGGASVGRGSD